MRENLMPSTPYQRRRRSYRPHLEPLEKREVPAVLTVTNLLDQGAGSLRAAVVSAQDGDTIQFADGISGQITLTSGEIAIRHSIDIKGPGAEVITVSGNHASRVFNISQNLTVSISRLTIAAGRSPTDRGGGIYNLLSTLNITDSIITGNSVISRPSAVGGGIENEGGRLSIIDSTLSDNSVSAIGGSGVVAGGGIENDGTLTVVDSTFSGNSAPGGVSGGAGGGISNSGPATVIDSTFSGNFADDGGAILNSVGSLTMLNSTLYGNAAIFEGTFPAVGGAIYTEGGPLTLTGCTLTGNVAETLGGGISSTPSSGGNLRNTIIAGNMAPSGPDVSGPVHSQGHNLVGDGTDGTGFDPMDLVGTADNPIDPLLGPLQNNAGPTPTMALLVGSPAIATRDITDAPPTDQRGAPRIVNGTIDIGAYEVQPSPAPSCSVAQSVLWPPNHQLINVGLSIQLNADADPGTQVSVQVYANDNANASDAADIGPGTLRLRSERQGNGRGRVYLIVATATDASGQTGFDLCTVVVPHDRSARSRAEVQTEAAAAAAYYQEFQTAPAGYALLGEGPAAASNHGWPSLLASLGQGSRLVPVAPANPPTALSQWPSCRAIPATDPTWKRLAGDIAELRDGYFVLAHEEPFRFRLFHLEATIRGNSEQGGILILYPDPDFATD
jgi:hypothetical protein